METDLSWSGGQALYAHDVRWRGEHPDQRGLRASERGALLQ